MRNAPPYTEAIAAIGPARLEANHYLCPDRNDTGLGPDV